MLTMDIFFTYVNALNKEIKNSLFYYTTEEYKNLNNKLRKGMVLSNSQKQHYDNILSAFEAGPTVRSTYTLYRGMNKKYTVFENDGFISTSKSKKEAMSFVGGECCLYIITLTPGEYTILPMEDISEHPEEEEVLLPPGKLSIQSITPKTSVGNEDGVDLIYCTYIPDNAEIIDLSNVSTKIKDLSLQLSTQSWVDRILDSGVGDFIKEFCEENSFDCLLEQIKTLDFFNDIPQEALDKAMALFSNVVDI